MDCSDCQVIKEQPHKSAAQVLKEQESKLERACKYCQWLLGKQQKKFDEEIGGSIMSPGYECGHQSTKLKKQKKQDKSDARNTTFLECAFNMANILMGVRMLGLPPYVFKSAGWVGGFFVTIFFCFITWQKLILIGRQLNGI
jgi:hypothetical protein